MSAKKKPTLSERIEAIKEEAESEVTRLSEEKRPEGVPAPWLRLNWLSKVNGNVFEAVLIASRGE